MIDLQPLLGLTLPRQPPLPAPFRHHALLDHTRQRRKPKRGKLEHGALLQHGAASGQRDGGAVLVVACPFAEVGEQGPDSGCGARGGDCFVGDKVVGFAWREVQGEEDAGLGGRAARERAGGLGECGLHFFVGWVNCIMPSVSFMYGFFIERLQRSMRRVVSWG